jgi:hypothetical protein
MKKQLFLLLITVLLVTSSWAQNYYNGDLYFMDQMQIDSFQVQLPGVSKIGGNVTIGGDAIDNLEGLIPLTRIDGNLNFHPYILLRGGLKSLSGLDSLEIIGGNLSLMYTDSIINLDGLSNLDSIGSLLIDGCGSLTNLDGLQNLKHISSDIYLMNNNSLIDISGLANVESLDGFIDINSNMLLESLQGLHNITEITGAVSISNNQSLKSVDLNNLGTAYGFYASQNPSLSSLEGLNKLKWLDYMLSIWNHDSLENLEGLDSLMFVDKIVISYNEGLQSLEGLAELVYDSLSYLRINNNLILSYCSAQGICDYILNPNGVVDIRDNDDGCNNPPQVAAGCGITLDCLPYGDFYFQHQWEIDSFAMHYSNCTELAGNVLINGDGITNLDGLSGITIVNGNLTIEPDPAIQMNLSSLSGLNNLELVAGGLRIENNEQLSSLNGLNSLESVLGGFYILNNDKLIDLNGLNSLDTVWGFSVNMNDSLQSLNGLNDIDYIGSLSISENTNLHSLDGLQNLEQIGGNFYLFHNDHLTDITSLSKLTNIGGDLTVNGNESLKSLDGLQNLKYAHSIQINQTVLENLEGLDSLQYVDSYFQLYDNDDLLHIEHLKNLTSAWILSINDNALLESLSGLDNLEYDSLKHVRLINNPLLSFCHIPAVCDFMSTHLEDYRIEDNAQGCFDEFQVQDSCGVGIAEYQTSRNITIFPNPATNKIYFRGFDQLQDIRISVYDQLGKEQIKCLILSSELDITDLEPGLYLIEFEQNEYIHRELIIKN